MQLGFPRKHIASYQGFWKDIIKEFFLNDRNNIIIVEEFERRFAEYIGVKYAVAVSSGRWGLCLILKALGIKEDDEVILPAITHPGIPFVVRETGAKPIFVDISEDSPNINIDQVASKINNKTKAIIGTHLFGIPCDIENIIGIANDRDISVIEDCAHGIGIEVNKKQVGSFGKAAFFSFETTKLINTLGGGIITTDDFNLYTHIKQMINSYRFPSRLEILKKILRFCVHKAYTNRLSFSITMLPLIRLFESFNMDIIQIYKKRRKIRLHNLKIRFISLQAILGLKQLALIEENINKITENTKFLKERIKSFKVSYIKTAPNKKDVQYLFTLFIDNKDIFRKFLLKSRIDCEKNILEICPKLFGYTERFDNAERFTKNALQISINAKLNRRDIIYIAGIINKNIRN